MAGRPEVNPPQVHGTAPRQKARHEARFRCFWPGHLTTACWPPSARSAGGCCSCWLLSCSSFSAPLLRAGASPPLKPRDVTCPPSLLVRSGRRLGAGPGHQASAPERLGRALAAALPVVLCTALMASPALLAAMWAVSAGARRNWPAPSGLDLH